MRKTEKTGLFNIQRKSMGRIGPITSFYIYFILFFGSGRAKIATMRRMPEISGTYLILPVENCVCII